MLVLKRKMGESLMIGDDIEITFLEKDGDTVKIGINAPQAIRILRKEIYDEIVTANQGAAQATDLQSLLLEYKQLKNDEK